jgi:ketosteroid isomerase-like protein
MQRHYLLTGLLVLLTGSISCPVFAQSGNDEAAVWATVEQQWRAVKRGETDWVEDLLSADFVGWPNNSPAPRNKTSLRLWTEFNQRQSELLEYELYPQSIVVHGNMAVVHYLYTTASKPRGGELTTSNGRYTDVLVRVDAGWKFIAWHGGDND